MARKNGSPNYVEFPFDKEMVVTLAEDRGRLSENDYGEYFLRKFDDGRFTCANPDLERRIIDTGARRGSVVSITKEKYGRSAVWVVKLLGSQQPEPAKPVKANGHAGAVDHAWRDLPAEKYAAPNGNGSTPHTLEDQLRASIADVDAEKAAPVQHTQPLTRLAGCFVSAIDALCVARDYAQSKGIDLRLHLEMTGSELQDLAATLYIAQAKAANVVLMNRNDSLRSQNGRA